MFSYALAFFFLFWPISAVFIDPTQVQIIADLVHAKQFGPEFPSDVYLSEDDMKTCVPDLSQIISTNIVANRSLEMWVNLRLELPITARKVSPDCTGKIASWAEPMGSHVHAPMEGFIAAFGNITSCLAFNSGRKWTYNLQDSLQFVPADENFPKAQGFSIFFLSTEVPLTTATLSTLDLDNTIFQMFETAFANTPTAKCAETEDTFYFDASLPTFSNNSVEHWVLEEGFCAPSGNYPYISNVFINSYDSISSTKVHTVNFKSWMTFAGVTSTGEVVYRSYYNPGLELEVVVEGSLVQTRPQPKIFSTVFGKLPTWDTGDFVYPLFMISHIESSTVVPWTSFSRYLVGCEPAGKDPNEVALALSAFPQTFADGVCGITTAPQPCENKVPNNPCSFCYSGDEGYASRSYAPVALGALGFDFVLPVHRVLLPTTIFPLPPWGTNKAHVGSFGVYPILGSSAKTGAYQIFHDDQLSDVKDLYDKFSAITSWYPIPISESFQSTIDNFKVVYDQVESLWQLFQEILEVQNEIRTFAELVGSFL